MSLPLAYHWDATTPPPRLALRLSRRRVLPIPPPPAAIDTGPVDRPFQFSAAMQRLCTDIVARSPALGHIDLSRVLFTIIRARNGAQHGLQARVTPLRFQNGTPTGRVRGRTYRIQHMTLHGRDILYLVTFCLPRFMNRDFEDKLITIVHELYHIGPACDGDLRRHAGRYCAHTGSKKHYDAHMAMLVKQYLANGADLSRSAFLRLSFGQLCRRHGALVGLHLPRPKLIPVGA